MSMSCQSNKYKAFPYIRLRLLVVFLLPFVFPLNGCVSTSAVAEFAAVSKVAAEKFPEVAADFKASCKRRSRYESLRHSVYDLSTIQKYSDRQCADFKALEPYLIAANKVLMEYMETMGRLASDDVVTFDKNLNDLAANLNAVGNIEQSQINAVNGIIKVISRAAADGWRRKKLAEVIGNTNDDVHILIAALKIIVGSDYKQLLSNEELGMKDYYLGSIKDFKKQDPLTVVLVHERWDEAEDSLQAKRAGADAYVQILEKIARGHQRLYDNRNKLNSKETKIMVLGYAKELGPLVKDLRKAF